MLSVLEDNDDVWRLGRRVLINVASHPVEYAKVLIQIGYEPFPPRQTVTWFGRPALGLPNIFQYIKHIYTVDGFSGCYRGLVPKLSANILSGMACEMAANYTTPRIIQDTDSNKEDCERTEERVECKRSMLELVVDLISKSAAIIISHPLDVITLRMMAQFVGRETNGLFRSVSEIYEQNGIIGFYAGLVPRLLGTAATLIIARTSVYVINRFYIREPSLLALTVSTARFVATTITYPFIVVSHCMAVNNSGLAAGRPPHMPIYDNWIDCWRHLESNNQLKRGSSLLWRYYTGPQHIINGRPVALNVDLYLQKKKLQ